MLPPEDRPEAAARFVTFYSYKGGVGRSMALANVASWLVTSGHRRVVAVDFDLEAPGLGYYFARSGLLGDATLPGPGLVELLTRYRTTGALPNLSEYVVEGPEQLGGGRLFLLPAGDHAAPHYAGDLAALDWNALYESGFGFELFEHLRVSLIDGYQPDLVLLDSRTGLHGIGAIAAQQLPDVVVLLFSLNAQNVDGTAQVLASVEANVFGPETGRAIRPLLVASPVYEPGLPEAADAIDRAQARLGRPLDARIPFSSAAVYGEAVWRVDDRDAPQDLLLEYARIGRLLGEGVATTLPPATAGTFEALAARLFELEGWSVRGAEPSERVDLVVERGGVLGRERLGVVLEAGTGRGQAAAVVDSAKLARRAGDLDRVLVYTRGPATKVLKAAAEKEKAVSVISMPEVLERLVDWSTYVRWVAAANGAAAWAEHLGRLELVPVAGDAPPEPADAWLHRWLDDERPLAILVGPPGAGRSTLSRWLAHDLAERWLAEAPPRQTRVPVLLPLERYRKSLSVDVLLADLLSDRRRFPGGGAPAEQRVPAVRLLNDEGRLLLVVEEIDTLPDPEAAMGEIARLAGPRAKILVNRYGATPPGSGRANLPLHHAMRFAAPSGLDSLVR